ncbi:hypothetical protein KIN20_003962 [Parelaphostrongylus tenuis]|uniref:NTR domain-containing protein n=1 Tax=Parelaphostrongylus tenuis TaxID=148309 RepID=A0AAD5LXN4_PARTN|nr:hypothetical protein KIN20_003962 [Parelaphostrongylus tenuis]
MYKRTEQSMLGIVYFLAFISTTIACNCTYVPATEAICYADWISHAKVVAFHNPYRDTTGFYNVMYTVEHIELFKSYDTTSPLAPVFFISSDEAECFDLSCGEYIISGRFGADRTLRASYCQQITDDGLGGFQKYQNVSKALLTSLQTLKC